MRWGRPHLAGGKAGLGERVGRRGLTAVILPPATGWHPGTGDSRPNPANVVLASGIEAGGRRRAAAPFTRARPFRGRTYRSPIAKEKIENFFCGYAWLSNGSQKSAQRGHLALRPAESLEIECRETDIARHLFYGSTEPRNGRSNFFNIHYTAVATVFPFLKATHV